MATTPTSNNSTPNSDSKVVSLAAMKMNATRMLSGMFNRARSAYLTSFGGRRDYNNIFGWDVTLTPERMMYMYNRGGIAKRVVDAYPDAVWSRPPIIWAPEDAEWTASFGALIKDIPLWNTLYRLDKLAGLHEYAVLVVGTDKPGLDKKLTKASKITYLQPYGSLSATITRYVTDTTDPNFGSPEMYRIMPNNTTSLTSRGFSQPVGVSPVRSSFDVHASRVLHIALNPLEDTIYGQPRMAAVWDYLTDLRKVVGSSSESYWIAANRGLQADIDKEMSFTAEDQAALEQEIDDFFDGFRRFMRTKGVKMESFKNELADPKSPFEVLITLISGTTGIPQRILAGSEAGQLASTQDKGNWAERVEENRALQSEPYIILPFLKFCISAGLVRAPKGEIKVLWPDSYRQSPLERGQTSAQTARTLANITKMLESKSDIARTLLTKEELRSLIGFSSDNRILSDIPDP